MTHFPLLLGIDLGTSSVKAVLVEPEGRLLASAGQEYPLYTPHPGWAEQNPEDWVAAAGQAIRQCLQQAGASGDQVKAISLAGQMHSTVCLDRYGQPLRPAIIWADQRSQAQVQQVTALLGKDKLLRWTGNPLATGFMLASWLWLRQHEAAVVRGARWLLLPKDYLRYRMTGQVGSEPSDASSTLLFDPFKRRWSHEMLSALAIDPNLLPPLAESSQIAGELLPGFAAATGLNPGTPVVYGGSDQALQALAQGVVTPGQVSCTIGTGGQILAPLLAPRPDPDLRLHLFCHAQLHLWHLEAAILTAGYSLRWLRDQVLPGADYATLAELATQAPAGCEGLFFLPYLAGERTPWMDPTARSALIGLSLRHDRRHIARAVMEGVVLALRQALELTLALAGPADRIIISGGAARHSLWQQLQADIFKLPVVTSPVQEATGRGAALLAGIGIGLYRDAVDAIHQSQQPAGETIHPVPERSDLYDRHFAQFIQLYPALRDTPA